MTSDLANPGDRAGDEVLAGEYVLGMLSLDARRAVERRMASDELFAQAVERWQRDFAPFNESYDEVLPSEDVLERIEQRLFGKRRTAAGESGLWHSLAFWRWLSLGMSAVALGALIYAAGLGTSAVRNGELVAELSAPSNAVNMLASYDPGSGRMRIAPVAAAAQEERSLELWFVPAVGDPLSLGVFPTEADAVLVIPADLREHLGDGATLAVTLEPLGGSPTGRATGPIVASGTARRL